MFQRLPQKITPWLGHNWTGRLLNKRGYWVLLSFGAFCHVWNTAKRKFCFGIFLLFNEKRTNKICYHPSPFYLLGLFMHCFSSVCPVRQNLAQLFFFPQNMLIFCYRITVASLVPAIRFVHISVFFFFYKMYFFQSSVFVKLNFFHFRTTVSSLVPTIRFVCIFFTKCIFFRIIHFCKLQFSRYRSKVVLFPSATDFTPIKKG